MVLLTIEHDPKIIVLSIGIAFIGAYLTICLCEHYRLYSYSVKNKSKLWGKGGQMALMSLSLGGVAIWGMHFVGMASMSLKTPDGVKIPVSFHIMPTVVSLIFVLLFAFAGLYISSLDVIFSKSQSEIVEMFVEGASEMSARQIRNISNTRLMVILFTKSLHLLCIGGLLAGSGVCCMHYLGMWAMTFSGHIIWNEGVIAGSLFIALIASTAAFWILFRLLSLHQHLIVLRLACALVMAIAVCGFHYTGMAAAKYEYDPDHKVNPTEAVWGAMSSEMAFTGAVISTLIFALMLVVLIVADLRAWLQATSDQLEKAEHLLYLIDDNSYSTAIRGYFEKKKTAGMRVSSSKKTSSSAASVSLFSRNSSSNTIVPVITLPSLNIFRQQTVAPFNAFISPQSSFRSEEMECTPLSPSHKLHSENLREHQEDLESGGYTYAKTRVGPKHEHPSIAGALSEYRVNENLEGQ